MVCRVTTFAFEGVEAEPVEVQVQLTGGNPNFHIVGLPDKVVGESRERVRRVHIAEALSFRQRPAGQGEGANVQAMAL